LSGVQSNRLAIGAKVKITAGSSAQVDEVHSGGGYLSQNDLRVHFGLGTASKVDAVEIRWPSGKLETLGNLKADAYYRVREGEGVISGDRNQSSK